MLSYILSALSVARHAVALTLVAGAAATTMVAGSVDQIGTQTQPQHRTAPMTSTAPTTKPEPKTIDIEALVKDCLTKYAGLKASTSEGTGASEACRRAIEASGLTSTEFWSRFAPKAEPSAAPVKPSASPASIEALANYCVAKYEAAKDHVTLATVASEVCRRAIEASGLSATEFWAKFGKPQAPHTEPKPTTTPAATEATQLTRYCLTMHAALTTASTHEQVERTTTVCNQAIAESKLTPTQFWTKFSASH